MLAYAAAAVGLLGKSEAPIAVLLITAILGVFATLLVGGVISEVIHCSYDRAGCINL